jgi:hypothetical protein
MNRTTEERTMKLKRILLLVLMLALLAGGIAYWKLTTPPSQNDGIADATLPAKFKDGAKPETEEEKARRKLLGVWQDDYQGKRTMTLNDDGSGTMVVKLSGVQAFLFASKLRFDMKWSLDGKTLTKRTVGGEPADKVNLILNTMGNTAEDTLLELTEERLLLLDKNGKTKYDWKRVKKDEPSKE